MLNALHVLNISQMFFCMFSALHALLRFQLSKHLRILQKTDLNVPLHRHATLQTHQLWFPNQII